MQFRVGHNEPLPLPAGLGAGPYRPAGTKSRPADMRKRLGWSFGDRDRMATNRAIRVTPEEAALLAAHRQQKAATPVAKPVPPVAPAVHVARSYKRFVFATDIHGDAADQAACEALHQFTDAWKPHYRICGGDVWDFRPLRRKASEHERREVIRPDFDAGMEFLKRLRPTHFLRGNHDERLWDAAGEADGPVRNFYQQLVGEYDAAFPDCEMFPYDKRQGVLRIGHLKFIHGFFSGKNAARQHAQAYGSCLFGHIHAIDEASEPGLDRKVARSVGCLCQIDFEYNRTAVNSLRHATGWAYGVIDDATGDYQVWQAEGINGRYVVAEGTRVIAA